jgi:carboxypeptidase D
MMPYAGLLPIDHKEDKYFFWFSPSNNANATDEISIWLIEGPGASSLDGLLHANGNFIWQPGTHAPVPNTWPWSNLTNVVWIDQPIGTGYANGQPNVRSQEGVVKHFLAFWKHFVDLFGLHDRKVYFAGESYAGKYVPYLANTMIRKHDPKYFNVAGMLLYNAGIGDRALQSEVSLTDFAVHHQTTLSLNASFAAHVQSLSVNCGFKTYLFFHYRFPPS